MLSETCLVGAGRLPLAGAGRQLRHLPAVQPGV